MCSLHSIAPLIVGVWRPLLASEIDRCVQREVCMHACMHVVWAVTWIRVASSNWIGCFSYDGAQWRCVVVVWCTYIEIELTSYWECTVKGFTYFNFVIQICDRRACGQLHSTECADSNEKVWHYRKRYRLSANSVSAIAIANYSIIVPSQAIDHPE